MSKKRRSTLNKQDAEWFATIVASWNLDEHLNEVIEFMRHLEDCYPIKNIDILDYMHTGFEADAKEPIFYSEKVYHIARVFLNTCYNLACYNGNKEVKNEYYDKFKRFCWNEIRKIDYAINFNPMFSGIASVLFDFFDFLIGSASANKDNRTLIRAYKSILRNIAFLDSVEMWDPSWLKGSHLSDVFEKLVNETYMDKDNPEKVIIRHEKVLRAYNDALSYAFDNEPCLIIGETGTGKERLAQIIHEFSDRRKNNHRTVNCGGFTESLFNSEIQGFLIGSFTGAVTSRLGAFLSACGKNEDGIDYGYVVVNDKIKFRTSKKILVDTPTEDELNKVIGTVFLDEINSLKISLQAVLLRIIQNQEVQVVGEDRSRKIKVKVVCATNAEPSTLITKGQLREDLYYRISKGIIKVPSLVELKDCMGEIVNSFVIRICKKLDIEGEIKTKAKTLKLLKQHYWPGNMRELENVLYRAIKKIEADNEDTIKPEHIEYLIIQKKDDNANYIKNYEGIKYDNLREDYLTYIHNKSNGNQSKAEELTGISRATISRDWAKYKLYKPNKRQISKPT